MKILTLPIKPSSYQKRGMYLAPLLAELLAKKANATSLTFLNLIDSYKEQSEFVKYLESEYQNLGIHTDQMTSDYKNKEKLYQLIENLTSSGHIFEAKRKVVLCPCGRIDCLEDSLDSKTGRTNYQESEFHKCKICQRPCLVEEKKVLLFHIPHLIKPRAPVFPLYSQRDLDEFNSKFTEKNILISKQRNTNIPFTLNGRQYNLDVDFFWSNYASLWDDPKKIILASQHSIYPSFLINILHQIHHPNSQLMTIYLPYIRNTNQVEVENELNRLSMAQKQLYLLYSLKFKDKTADWHPSAFNNISKIDDNKAKEMLEILGKKEQPKTPTFQSQIIQLIQQINVQSLIQNSKKKQKFHPFQQNTDTGRL